MVDFQGIRDDGQTYASTVSCSQCATSIDVSTTGLSESEAAAQDYFHSRACYETWLATQ